MYPELLQPFTMARLKEIREKRGEHDSFQSFWNELGNVLNCRHPKSNEWKKIEKDEVVVGEVWSQHIGEFYYKHTVHKFSYLCVCSKGLAIKMHGHYEPANDGRQIRKFKEFYVYPDGIINVCGKDQEHGLFNKGDKPIYVLSVKVGRNGTR